MKKRFMIILLDEAGGAMMRQKPPHFQTASMERKKKGPRPAKARGPFDGSADHHSLVRINDIVRP
jgi:hypothetical protein